MGLSGVCTIGGEKIANNSATDLAACLMALGVKPLEGTARVSNTGTEKRPARPGQPGVVMYHLEPASSTFPKTSAQDLIAAFYSGDGHQELDDLIEQVDNEELRAKLQRAIAPAAASYIRAALTNRNRCSRWWRDATPMVLIRRGRKTFLINRDHGQAAAEKWGLTKKR